MADYKSLEYKVHEKSSGSGLKPKILYLFVLITSFGNVNQTYIYIL